MKKIRSIVDRDVRTLKVYQEALEVLDHVKFIYDGLPYREKDVLGNQAWRAATSIIGNISEANANLYLSVNFRQLNSALASAGELCTWIELFCRYKYINQDISDCITEKLGKVRRMLIGMLNKLAIEIENEIDVA